MANRVLSVATVCGLGLSILVLAGTERADAQTTPIVASDRAAGFVVFPKVVADPDDTFRQGRSLDTVIQLTNLNDQVRVVHCFYVDATSRCTNGGNFFSPTEGACRTNADCNVGGTCEPGWTPSNFSLVLSPHQPTAWSVSSGRSNIFLTPNGTQTVDPVQTSFFIGELKCFEVDGTQIGGGTGATTTTPINANDLKGEATIYEVAIGVCAGGTLTGQVCTRDANCLGGGICQLSSGRVDARSYNAIGIQAGVQCTAGTVTAVGKPCTVNSDCGTGGVCVGVLCTAGTLSTVGQPCASNTDCGTSGICNFGTTQNDRVMCLGGTAGSSECPPPVSPLKSEYANCPSTLILNNLFDITNTVKTDLTLVPCTENFVIPSAQPVTVVQYLVFNEFEQKLSGSTTLDCFKEEQLSHLDKQPGDEVDSIFNVAVQGTLAGQTRLRAVTGRETNQGHGVLGVAEEFRQVAANGQHGALFGSAAYNLNYVGQNTMTGLERGDFVRFTLP